MNKKSVMIIFIWLVISSSCTICKTNNMINNKKVIFFTNNKKKKVIGEDLKTVDNEEKARWKEKITIQRALTQIENGQQQILKYTKKTQKKILIIGYTGSGKSTLINGITDKALIFKELTEEGKKYEMKFYNTRRVIDVVGNTNIKIRHWVQAETTIPDIYFSKNVNLIDCPGFEDSRGSIEEIVNSFFINFLFRDQIKLLLVIPNNMLYKQIYKKRFGDLIKKLKQILRDILIYRECIGIVVTKTNETKEEVKRKLMIELITYNDIKTRKKDKLSDQDIKLFLDIINSDKMDIFPTPKKIGRVDRKDINYIVNMLSKTKFIEAKNVNITVSSEAMNYVSEIGIVLNEDIYNTISAICTSIQNSIEVNLFTIKYLNYLKNLEKVIGKLIETKQNDVLSYNYIEEQKTANNFEKDNVFKNSLLDKFISRVMKYLLDNVDFFEDEWLKDNFKKHCNDLLNKSHFLKFLYKINPNKQKSLQIYKWINNLENTKQFINDNGIKCIE